MQDKLMADETLDGLDDRWAVQRLYYFSRLPTLYFLIYMNV